MANGILKFKLVEKLLSIPRI